jgi:hypothetical protein
MDQVEEYLKRMKKTGWRVKAEDREEWSKLLNRPRPTQGCRVDRRRRRYLRHKAEIGGLYIYVSDKSQCPNVDSNLVPPVYKPEALPPKPNCQDTSSDQLSQKP